MTTRAAQYKTAIFASDNADTIAVKRQHCKRQAFAMLNTVIRENGIYVMKCTETMRALYDILDNVASWEYTYRIDVTDWGTGNASDTNTGKG